VEKARCPHRRRVDRSGECPGRSGGPAPQAGSTADKGENSEMTTITTKDGVEIFYKDWGSGQPIVFSHGWPLSADDWDAQMLFF
jgi:hypothetical protein